MPFFLLNNLKVTVSFQNSYRNSMCTKILKLIEFSRRLHNFISLETFTLVIKKRKCEALSSICMLYFHILCVE